MSSHETWFTSNLSIASKRVQKVFRIDPDIKNWVETTAERFHLTQATIFNALLRKAIEKYMEDTKQRREQNKPLGGEQCQNHQL